MRLYFILLSRSFNKPLHALMQGSRELCRMLMDTVSTCLPPDHLHHQTSMSGGSLYYTRTKAYWKNKVLYLSSIDKGFKGVGTLNEFIENQILKRYTTESDYLTRQLYASGKQVEGPVCLMAYSEDENINAKYFNECFLLRVDENSSNKAQMLTHLKKESANLIDTQVKEQAIRTLRAIGSNLKPLKVIIPYADQLDLPELVSNSLRSYTQLTTFIKAVALLHQHTLKVKTSKDGEDYIEATAEHLEIALELMKGILTTQSDLLSLNQRSFIERLKAYVKEEGQTFKIPNAIRAMRMSSTSFYREFNHLKGLGYILFSGGNKKKGIEYRIANWSEYAQLSEGTDKLDEQLIEIKKGSFSQVSQKIPKGNGKLKLNTNKA